MIRRQRLFPILAAVLIGALVASCSRFDLVNSDRPGFPGQITANVVFDQENGLALDVYRPSGDDVRPTIVFWYGGSWQSGTRQDYQFVGIELAKRGFNVVIPDYRKYPDVTYPNFVRDAAAAFAWTHNKIGRLGGDPRRIIVMGHSAGAHSAMMLATDARFLAHHGLTPAAIRGVIGLAGPYNFQPTSRTLTRVFNGASNFPAMQAANFVDGDEPPIVMMHGLDDSIVGRINIDRMVAALKPLGICYQTRLYPDVGHVGMIGAFTWAYPTVPVVPDIVEFAKKLDQGALCGQGSGR